MQSLLTTGILASDRSFIAGDARWSNNLVPFLPDVGIAVDRGPVVLSTQALIPRPWDNVAVLNKG
jgi:hypothetical protein